MIAAGPARDRAGARAAAGARGQRVRVGRRPLPALAARGDRGARGRHDGARGVRRRGDRPLPQLRAHRAASSSTAPSRRTNASGSSNVANRADPPGTSRRRPVIGITAYAEPSVRWGVWDVPAAVIPLAYVQAGRGRRRPAAARAPERGRDRGDARRPATGSSSPAARTSTRRNTARSRIPRRTARDLSGTAASWRCSRRRSSATCRCWPSAVARRC